MLRIKRWPLGAELEGLEPWLEWQVRSMRYAGEIIKQHKVDIIDALNDKRREWAMHIARFGHEHRAQHLLKAVLSWRNVFWWKQQEVYNVLSLNPLRHPYFCPRRWEDAFAPNWMHDFTL